MSHTLPGMRNRRQQFMAGLTGNDRASEGVQNDESIMRTSGPSNTVWEGLGTLMLWLVILGGGGFILALLGEGWRAFW